jgi:hypothetical protein
MSYKTLQYGTAENQYSWSGSWFKDNHSFELVITPPLPSKFFSFFAASLLSTSKISIFFCVRLKTMRCKAYVMGLDVWFE